MIRAIYYLQTRSFINRLLSRLRRLRQPKYLVGGIVGVLYVYFYFAQQFFFRRGHSAAGPKVSGEFLELVGALALLVIVIVAWIIPSKRSALVFSEAEIAFLFPAPVSRRALIHYKLIRSQLAILFTTLVLTLVTGRLAVGGMWIRVLGWWIILSTLNLHLLAASFIRTLLLDRGFSSCARRLVVLATLGMLIGAAFWWARGAAQPLLSGRLESWADLMRSVHRVLSTRPLAIALYPFKAVLQPYFAAGAREFIQALPAAMLIMAVHYVWVVRANVAFEEASVELSRRIAERVSAARAGRHPAAGARKEVQQPFTLSPIGPAATGILWKNIISARSVFRLRTLLVLLLPIIVVSAIMGSEEKRGGILVPTLTMITGILLGWSLIIGSQLVRFDLRQDLAVIDVFKAFPLRGWQVVLGEMLAPALILTCIQWTLLIVLAALLFYVPMEPKLPTHLVAPALVIGLLVLPFWNGVVLLIPNAAVLLFPGWFNARSDAPQGIEVTGQRLVLLIAQAVVAALALVPSAVAFALAFGVGHALNAPRLGMVAGGVLSAIVLAAEIALGVFLLGKLFDRFDLSLET